MRYPENFPEITDITNRKLTEDESALVSYALAKIIISVKLGIIGRAAVLTHCYNFTRIRKLGAANIPGNGGDGGLRARQARNLIQGCDKRARPFVSAGSGRE
jgi:hypothetical protein